MPWLPFNNPDGSSGPENEYDRSKDEFYLPICKDIITTPPRQQTIVYAPGLFPADILPEEKTPRPTKRTNVCAVAQSVVFWLFACSACRGTSQKARTRKEAEMANLSIKERWKHEMENRPRIMRRHSTAPSVVDEDGNRIDVPMYVGGTIPGISSMTPNPNTHGEGDYDHESIYSADPRTRNKAKKARKKKYAVGTVPNPTITGAVDTVTLSALDDLRRDVGMMILPPPAPIWKGHGPGRQNPRLAVAENDGLSATDPKLYRRGTTSHASQRTTSSRASASAKPFVFDGPVKMTPISSGDKLSREIEAAGDAAEEMSPATNNAPQFPLPVASLPTPRSSLEGAPALLQSTTTTSGNASLAEISCSANRSATWGNTVFQIATTPNKASSSPDENECLTPVSRSRSLSSNKSVLSDLQSLDGLMDTRTHSPAESVREIVFGEKGGLQVVLKDGSTREICPMGKRSANIEGRERVVMLR